MTWKKIRDFSNYEVNKSGLVRNTKTGNYIKSYVDSGGGRAGMTRTGYLRMQFSQDKKRKKFFLHRLIAEAFIPNPKNKPQVNHIDGNPLNNKLSNLEWNTAKENIQHAWKKGLTIRDKLVAGHLKRKIEKPEEYKAGIEKMKSSRTGRPLDKLKKKVIDSDGNIFSCLKEAAVFHNLKGVSGISNVLTGNRSRIRGKSFAYYFDENTPIPTVPKKKLGNSTRVISSEGKIFDSVSKAAEYYDINSYDTILRQIRGRNTKIKNNLTFKFI